MAIPAMKNCTREQLSIFSTKLRDCIAAFKESGSEVELHPVVNFDRIISKITAELRLKCGESVMGLERHAALLYLDLWLEARIKALSLSDPFGDSNKSSEKR